MKKIIFVILILSFAVTAFVRSGIVESKDKTDNVGATTEKKVYQTYTGRKPLPEVSFEVNDPQNSAGLSVRKIAHSYGVAKNEAPHQISVDSQSTIEKWGYRAVTLDTSGDKVLYLTFDCGYENGNTARILDTLKQKNVKAAFFCTLDDIKSSPDIIARMLNEGHIVGNHSSTHPSFAEIDRLKMAEELEECENYLRKSFGYAPKFFRFPKGEYSQSALELIDSIGYTSVFWSLAYADWDTTAQRGGDYAFDKVTSRLHPGAIILLHSVSSDNAEALGRIIDYAVGKGYTFKSLDTINLDYSK